MTEQSKTSNPLQTALIGLLVVAAFLVGSLWTKVKTLEGGTTAAKNQVPTGEAGQVAGEAAPTKVDVDPLQENDHVRGDKNARILLIEYSDTECPFCKRFHPTAQQVVDDYKGQVAWVYRHFPLDSLHSKARKEAEASECANELGGNEAFWKYLDKIYEITPANNGLDPNELPKIAVQVGLDQAKFKSCLDSGRYAPAVEANAKSGTKAGVSGTPGTILLDTKTGKTTSLPGAVPVEQVKAAIDVLLQ